MATQSGTLKAGYQLYIDIQNGDSSTVFDYTVTGASVRDNGKAWKSDRVIGPFSEDVSFTVTYTGSPSIYKVQPNGQREYTAATLPASLPAGAVVNVDGFVGVSSGGASLTYLPRSVTLLQMQNLIGFAGARCRLTDYPDAPDFTWDSTTSRWKLTAPWSVFEDSIVKTRTSANVSGDTTDALLHSVVLPNVMGPNSRVQIRYYYTSGAGTTTSKTVYAKWAGTGLPTSSINAGQTGRVSEVNIYNDNSLISQKAANADNPTGSLTNAIYTLNGDTANPLTIGFFGKFGAAVSGESVSIQHIGIIIYP